MELTISLLNFNFVMIHIIHKILVWIKNPIILKIVFLNSFLRSAVEFYLKKCFFFIIYNDEKSKI